MPPCSSTAPKAIAAITSQIVTSMLLIPPRVSKSSTATLPVSDTNPFASASQTPFVIAIHFGRFAASANARTTAGCMITARIPPNSAPNKIVGIGGTFLYAITNTTAIGSNAQGVTLNAESRVVFSSPSAALSRPGSPPNPMDANITSAIRNEGKVVHAMCWMCVNRSIPTTAGARFVVSDSGDILSPK